MDIKIKKCSILYYKCSNGSEFQYLDQIDQLVVIDNSKTNGEIILEADKSGIKYYLDELPEWAQIIDRQLQTRDKTKK